jgi:hypothetical protein
MLRNSRCDHPLCERDEPSGALNLAQNYGHSQRLEIVTDREISPSLRRVPTTTSIAIGVALAPGTIAHRFITTPSHLPALPLQSLSSSFVSKEAGRAEGT